MFISTDEFPAVFAQKMQANLFADMIQTDSIIIIISTIQTLVCVWVNVQ